MNKRLRPFDIAKDIISVCGLDISYFYDDLIFADHSLFIIQFDDNNPENFKLYFNKDCELDNKISIKDKLYEEAEKKGIQMRDEGTFFLTEDAESKEITIHYE